MNIKNNLIYNFENPKIIKLIYTGIHIVSYFCDRLHPYYIACRTLLNISQDQYPIYVSLSKLVVNTFTRTVYYSTITT